MKDIGKKESSVETRLQELDTVRGHVLRFAQLQRHMHAQMKRTVESERFLATIARRERAVISAVNIAKIAQHLNEPDLATEMNGITARIGNRYASLTLYAEQTIEAIFLICRAFIESQLPLRAFRTLFGEHAQIVEWIVRTNHQGCAELEKPAVRTAILDCITSEQWSEQVETCRQDTNQTRQGHVASLQQHFDTLLGVLKSKQAVATALRVNRSTLASALKGRASPTTMRSLTQKAQRLAADLAREPDAGAGHSAAGLTRPVVLTADSFRHIEDVLGPEDIAFIKARITLARELLAYCIQLKDSCVRKHVREQLSPEVEELFLMLRAFTEAYPNRILPLLDAQRNMWASSNRNNQ